MLATLLQQRRHSLIRAEADVKPGVTAIVMIAIRVFHSGLLSWVDLHQLTGRRRGVAPKQSAYCRRYPPGGLYGPPLKGRWVKGGSWRFVS